MDDGTAQPKNDAVSSPPPAQPMSVPSGGIGSIEREGGSAAAKEQSLSTHGETAPPPEQEPTESKTMQQQGVVAQLPPNIKTLAGTPAPAAATAPLFTPTVRLPVSDDTVARGLHAQAANSLLWLALWCIKKLKKAHILLKVVHGEVVRVKE